MSRAKKNVVLALAVTSVSALTAYLVRRRRNSPNVHVGLYFEDGSMVSLPESSPQSTELLDVGRRVVDLVHGTD